MARIFLSHSTANDAEAVALRDWLATQGWDDIFLDLDPERGIVAGERWESALNEAANRCEAVLFLISRAWLDSRWCMKEFNLAHRLNKRLFGILIEDLSLSDLPADLTGIWQIVRLGSGRDHQMIRATLPVTGEQAHITFSTEGLARLKAGLLKAGLDARYFAWPPENDPDRPPYRGMRPLEAEDAGIFFGRDAAIIEALDQLRGLREAVPPRLFVILGASGAGKSSVLRAGLIPRLRRDDRCFLPLPIIRPERAALLGEMGFVRSLETGLNARGFPITRTQIKDAVTSGAEAVARLLGDLIEKARVPERADAAPTRPPTLILAVDQGEELFLSEGSEEAATFLGLFRALLELKSIDLIGIVTIRSNSYELLQAAPSLEGIKQHTFSLAPMPKGAYQEVIEGPARQLTNRRSLKIEPQLTSALLTDIEAGGAKDALPLLAFTLERLYLEYGGDGDLKLSEYEQLGRIKGAIEAAVERAFSAADSDPTIPRDRQARLVLLRRGLIPWLAGIDPDTAAPRRRVARLSEIPTEARPLIKLLIEQRLLTTDVARDTGEITIEPAHEVLLRQWGVLEGWLAEDFGDLAALDGLRRATRDWAANGKLDAWLIHTGPRLEQAERVAGRKEFAAFVDPTESSYLTAARAVEDVRQRARLRRLRRDRLLSGTMSYGPLAAALIALLALFYAPSKERIESVMRWAEDGRAVLLADRVADRHEDIVVVLVDPATFNDTVISPIPRDTFAQLIGVLDAMGPRAMGLDFFFVAPQDSEKDLLFLDAVRSAKSPIVVGAIEADNLDQPQKDFQQQFLSSSGRPAGLLSLHYDGDHVIRRTSTSGGPASKEGFAHSVARAAGASLKAADQLFEFMPIAWVLGPNHNEPFLTISAKDLLPGANQARLSELQRLIAGKIVLIGIDMPNSDLHDTSLSASTGDKMLGVMVHAQILAQLLDGRYLMELAATPRRVLLFVVALFGFCLGWVAKPRLSGLLTIIMATGILVALDAASYSFLRIALPVGLDLYVWLVAIVAGWSAARLMAWTARTRCMTLYVPANVHLAAPKRTRIR